MQSIHSQNITNNKKILLKTHKILIYLLKFIGNYRKWQAAIQASCSMGTRYDNRQGKILLYVKADDETSIYVFL